MASRSLNSRLTCGRSVNINPDEELLATWFVKNSLAHQKRIQHMTDIRRVRAAAGAKKTSGEALEIHCPSAERMKKKKNKKRTQRSADLYEVKLIVPMYKRENRWGKRQVGINHFINRVQMPHLVPPLPLKHQGQNLKRRDRNESMLSVSFPMVFRLHSRVWLSFVSIATHSMIPKRFPNLSSAWRPSQVGAVTAVV